MSGITQRMTGSANSLMGGNNRRFTLEITCLFFAVSFTGLLVATNFALLQDGDTFWHVATGRWIVENMAVPRTDVFSHTYTGEVWLAKEWLSQLLLYLAYMAGGWKAVNVFALLVVSICVSILSWICLTSFRLSVAVGVIFLATIFASVHYLARPHLLAYPIMMIWVAGVVFAADKQRLPSYWLVPLMALWANMHGGFTLGLALAGLMSLETLMGVPRAELRPQIIRHGMFLALATLAALITPFGIQSILITPKIMGLGEVLDHVGEWKSPDFHLYEFHLVVLMGLLGLALSGGLKLKPMRTVAIILISYLMFKHVRTLPVFALLMPILLARPVTEQFSWLGFRHQLNDDADDPILQLCQRYSRLLPAIAAAIFGAGLFVAATTDLPPGDEGKGKPISSVAFAKANGLTGNVYNDYDLGGYLIFSGIPTFIDGRAELYGREFFNAYYSAAWQLKGGDLFKLLDDHDIDWTLLRPNSGGAVALTQSPDWQCVHAKGIAVVHVRISAPGNARALAAAKADPCTTVNAE
ncbi:MAG: hypothetical protein HKN11_19990 [Rhizobiales bacterium]|nr:hypothetical protein [Hyphomicrobiales bacterium]